MAEVEFQLIYIVSLTHLSIVLHQNGKLESLQNDSFVISIFVQVMKLHFYKILNQFTILLKMFVSSKNFPFCQIFWLKRYFCTCKLVTKDVFQSKINFGIPHIYQVLRKSHGFGVSRNSDSTIHVCITTTNIIRISILAIGYSNHCTTQLPEECFH